jgi:trk system potassium uptake protein TrkA
MGIEAVSSTTYIANLIEMEATEGAVHTLVSLAQGNLVLTEVAIPKRMVGKSKGASRRVADISGDLPADSLLVAVGQGDQLELINGDTELHPGDVVLVVSKQGVEGDVRDVLSNLW